MPKEGHIACNAAAVPFVAVRMLLGVLRQCGFEIGTFLFIIPPSDSCITAVSLAAHMNTMHNSFLRATAWQPVPFGATGRRIRSMHAMAPRATTASPDISILDTLRCLRYGKELQDACDAVRLASRLCQVVQKQLIDSEKVDKNDASPVTVADYGAQVLVAWALAKAEPSMRLSMVAEEDAASLRQEDNRPMLERITQLVNDVISTVEPSTQLTSEQIIDLIELGNSQGGSTGRHWVLDPIDGTRGFVGMRQYAVCLGMLQDGEVVLGVLGCPNLPQGEVGDEDGDESAVTRSDDADVGCLFFAHKGSGAYMSSLWDSNSKPVRIHVNDIQDASHARFMESYESRHSNRDITAAVARQAGVTQPPLRMDSQVKYGLLSRGGGLLFMRFPPPTYREKIWDHAAGVVVVQEAGGKVTDAKGRPLDFSNGRYLDLALGIIAAPPTIHQTLIQAAQNLEDLH